MIMRDLANTEYRNILIIKPSAVGDIISALPVLPALKSRYPEARISWLVATHLADLLRDHPLIDELIEFDRRRFGYMIRSWTVTKRFLTFLRRLRESQFDLVLDLQGLFRSGFLTWATRAPVRIGPSEKREFGWVFYTHRIPERPHDSHIVDRIAAVGELLHLDLSDPSFVVHLQQQAAQRIDQLLLSANLTPDRFIAIAPGGTWSSKRWPAAKFTELAEKIVAELDRPVVLVGGKAEIPLAREILRSKKDPRIHSFVGQTSLSELLCLLNRAGAVVCNDSGPMHMAVALGKPVTAIIGPTNALRTGPYRRTEGVVRTALNCSPCYRKKCNLVGEFDSSRCMQDISVEDVFRNLRSQLMS